MKKFFLSIVLALVTFTAAHADQKSHQALAERYYAAIGYEENMKKKLELQADEYSDFMLEKYACLSSNQQAAVKADMRAAYLKNHDVSSYKAFLVNDAVANYSESELSQMIAMVESPIGQKLLKTERKSSEDLYQVIKKSDKDNFTSHTVQYYNVVDKYMLNNLSCNKFKTVKP